MTKVTYFRIIMLFLGMTLLFQQMDSYAQNPTYACDVRNPSYVSANVYEFDLFITRTGTIPLELANYQAGIQVNPLLVNGGTISASIVPGSSALFASQQPSSISFVSSTNCIRLAPKAPPRTLNPGTSTSVTNGTIISDNLGTKICRVRLTNTLAFGFYALSPSWNFDINPYNTVVSAFIGPVDNKVNTIITNPEDHGRSLDVSVLLEGPYETSTGLMNPDLTSVMPLSQPYNTAPWNYSGAESVTSIPTGVVDWVLVDLRDATDPTLALPGTSKAKRAFFLRNDGSIVDLDGISAPGINFTPANNVYMVVRHRNHIDVMSNGGLQNNSGIYTYDFSTAVSQAYNGEAGYKEIGTGVFGMVAGDGDQDGKIFASDYNVWSTSFGQTNVYSPADYDMDKNNFASDYNTWSTNFGKNNPVTGVFVDEIRYSSQVPENN